MIAPVATAPAVTPGRHRVPRWAQVGVGCLAAGLLIVAAVPPWGWWPLALVGVALLDLLVADQNAAVRFRRTWLVTAAWLAPGMVWMWDMTPPGYLVAVAAYSGFVGLAVAAAPSGAGRRVALPGAIALAEAVRWAWPFGGVPLASLALGQAGGPLAPVVRIAGPVLLVVVVVVAGQAVAAVVRGERRAALAGAAVVALALVLAAVAPRAAAVGELDVALVQGGGPQRTRAVDTDRREVFERHLRATEAVSGPVDLVLWPENVVSTDGDLMLAREGAELAELARRLDTTLVAGVVESRGPTAFDNAAVVFSPDGELVDRYDKVRRVPFGEYVPLRRLLEPIAGGVLPGKDARPGTGRAVLDTPAGRFAVAISWEVFFAGRAREGVIDGGELLLNPTNGSSYWLTVVQSQQIAASQLRALETDRWVLQAAPTGFSALISPTGEVVERSAVSETRVIEATVERRAGHTLAVRLGDRPPMALAALLVLAGWVGARRAATVLRARA